MSPDSRIPDGSVIITPTEMYQEMRAVRDEVKHLSSIVDPAMAEIRADVHEGKAHRAELEKRVRDLETRSVVTPRGMWAGAGVLTAAVGVIATVIPTVIR